MEKDFVTRSAFEAETRRLDHKIDAAVKRIEDKVDAAMERMDLKHEALINEMRARDAENKQHYAELREAVQKQLAAQEKSIEEIRGETKAIKASTEAQKIYVNWILSLMGIVITVGTIFIQFFLK